MKSISLTTSVVALAAVLGLASCGGDDDVCCAPPDDPDRLIAYLPSDAGVVSYIDLDAVRSELGLGANADPLDLEGADFSSGSTSETRLVELAAIGFPEILTYLQTLEEPPLLDALDGSALSELASAGQGDDLVVVARTSQPFDELASLLEERDYLRKGDAFVARDGVQSTIKSIALPEDGLLVLAGDAEAAERISEAGPGRADGSLASEVNGSVRLTIEGDEGECVTSFGFGQDAEGTTGELALRVADGAPDPARADLSESERLAGVDFGAPEVEGDMVSASFAGAAPGAGDELPVRSLQASLAPFGAYEC